MMNDEPLRKLPAVNEVLDALAPLDGQHGREQMLQAVREELEEVRGLLKAGGNSLYRIDLATIAGRVADRLRHSVQPLLRPVINATGIVLHTNLGRAPVAEVAARAAYEAARGYLNLEMDLESGKRSSRQDAIRHWIVKLTEAESATVVNNNAAATVIVLRALCRDREVIVSRGQLIEIGGSFRIPEIMATSGAKLREVGTTNITRIEDYRKAIHPVETAALMHIHTSNYRVSGFTESVSTEQLVALGRRFRLPVIDDVGSGAMVDLSTFGFQNEPVVRDSIRAGADLVLFSGDKLLGGPQAGIIVGRKDLIDIIEKDPLMRAFRLDKMTLASLEATLGLYLNNEEKARHEVPVLQMLAVPVAELRRRAEELAQRLRQINTLKRVEVMEETAYVGGGSLPDQAMRTVVIAVQAADVNDAELAERLRAGTPAVVGRLQQGNILLDLRTIFPDQEQALVECVRAASNVRAK
jgi:L-seryl-tRNA(Ser) seleniumtransferase